MDENLTGYTGPSFFDVGYIYAPYVPVMRTPVILEGYNSNNEIMSQYSNRSINLTYYRNLILTDDQSYFGRRPHKVNWIKEGF